MSGLALMALVIAYVTVAVKFFHIAKSFWGKAAVVALAVLLPTADEIYYHYRLDAYCSSEAGYTIFENASRKAGLVDDELDDADGMKVLVVDFVESFHPVPGQTYRFERFADGSVGKVAIQIKTAPYEFVREENFTGAFLESRLSIVNLASDKTLSRLTDLNYYGGWVRRHVLGGLADSGPTQVEDCGFSDAYLAKIELINRTFTLN